MRSCRSNSCTITLWTSGTYLKEVRNLELAKTIAACLVGLSLTLFLVLPTIAAERPTTQVECQSAGMRWVERAGKCKNRVAKQKLSSTEKVIGLIGLGCVVVGLVLLFGTTKQERR